MERQSRKGEILCFPVTFFAYRYFPLVELNISTVAMSSVSLWVASVKAGCMFVNKLYCNVIVWAYIFLGGGDLKYILCNHLLLI